MRHDQETRRPSAEPEPIQPVRVSGVLGDHLDARVELGEDAPATPTYYGGMGVMHPAASSAGPPQALQPESAESRRLIEVKCPSCGTVNRVIESPKAHTCTSCHAQLPMPTNADLQAAMKHERQK